MKGKQLDLESTPAGNEALQAENATGRRFLGVHFLCCDVYTRVYVNRDATAYVGNCPKCAKQVRFQIGAGGTDSRFFQAS